MINEWKINLNEELLLAPFCFDSWTSKQHTECFLNTEKVRNASLLSNMSHTTGKSAMNIVFVLFDDDDTPSAPLSLAGWLAPSHQPTIQQAKVEQNTILQAATINKHQIWWYGSFFTSFSQQRKFILGYLILIINEVIIQRQSRNFRSRIYVDIKPWVKWQKY